MYFIRDDMIEEISLIFNYKLDVDIVTSTTLNETLLVHEMAVATSRIK